MRYPGGKGKSFQQIINLLPPHQTYIESHLGGGAVMRHKLPSVVNIGVDIDDQVISRWQSCHHLVCDVVQDDASRFLRSTDIDANTLIYADPPYVASTRRRSRVYRHDYTDEQHEELLAVLTRLSCMVVISGYASPLYESELCRWNRIDFSAKTHSGMRTESVWFNFEKPDRLHDPRYVGKTYREREVIKRRQQRIRSRINRLPEIERHALLEWMQNSTASEIRRNGSCK